MSAEMRARRSRAGPLSSARTFYLPPGSQIDPDRVRGYPIDLRVKARDGTWPSFPPDAPDRLYVGFAQHALGCYEHWLTGAGDRWLDTAIKGAEYLLERQQRDGSWPHPSALAHTFDLSAGWLSAMAQGQAASLFVRVYAHSGDERLANGALRALEPLYRDVRDGGVRRELGDGPWFEEYPTTPPSFVLNGAIFALWGLRDVAIALDDTAAADAFRAGVDSLVANLPMFDCGFWSLYSLYPHPVPNLASGFYHSLHIAQLDGMDALAPHPELVATRERFSGYAASRAASSRAMAGKIAFRLLVPRNRQLGRRAARLWARRGSTGASPQ